MRVSFELDLRRKGKRSDQESVWDRPSAWLIEALGGGKAKSGVVVTETTAMNLSAVYGATAIISGSIASLPLILYRRLPDGSRERATRHPIYWILKDRPNSRMTAYQWKEMVSHHVDIWGNHYSYIDRAVPGRLELLPMLPDRTRMVAAAGVVKYTTIINGEMIDIPPSEVLHIAGLGFDGRRGYGVVRYAKQSLGLALATEEYGSYFFANDATPGGVIEHPNAFRGPEGTAAIKRLRKSWEEQHRSMENKHKVAILEEGAKYHEIGVPPEQAQFLASRKFGVSEVARWFGLPLSKLKDLDRAIQANMEQQSLEYFQDCLLPRMTRIEEAIQLKLLGTDEREEYYVEFLHEGLLRADTKTRNEAFEIQRRNGVLNADEWRTKENMNPTGTEAGKALIVPMNMMALDDLLPTAQDTPDEDDTTAEPAAVDEGEKIQDTALNGAQIEGLLSIISQIVAGLITKGTAKEIILLAFPTISADQVDAMLAEIEEGSDPEAVKRALRSISGIRSRTVTPAERRTVEARRRLTIRYRSRITRFIRSLIEEETAVIRAALARHLSSRDETSFGDWLKQYYREFRSIAKQRAAPVFQAYGELLVPIVQAEVGVDQDVSAELDSFNDEYSAVFAAGHTSASRGEIYRVVNESEPEELEESIEATLEDWEQERVEDDTHLESIRSENAFTKRLFAVLGVLKIMSVALGDSCPFCTALDGVVIGIDEVFLSAGVAFQPDGADEPLIPTSNRGHPPYHKGCDCGIVVSR